MRPGDTLGPCLPSEHLIILLHYRPSHHQYEDVLNRVLELVVLLDDDMTQALGALGLTRSRTHLL